MMVVLELPHSLRNDIFMKNYNAVVTVMAACSSYIICTLNTKFRCIRIVLVSVIWLAHYPFFCVYVAINVITLKAKLMSCCDSASGFYCFCGRTKLQSYMPLSW